MLEKFKIENDSFKMRRLYENLFFEIINYYEKKKIYLELPCFLNYLILQEIPSLRNFLKVKIQNSKNFLNASDFEIIKFISKNLDEIFLKYTNSNITTLKQLQMIMFNNLGESYNNLNSSSIIKNNNNVFDLLSLNKNIKILNCSSLKDNTLSNHLIESKEDINYNNFFESKLNFSNKGLVKYIKNETNLLETKQSKYYY